MTGTPLLADDVTLGYDRTTVATNLTVGIPEGSFTVIVGPNGCGKSTLLRSLARLLKPASGAVLLDGRDLREQQPKEVAKRVGLLPQSATAPEGITVVDLVRRGRYPHQSLLKRWSTDDTRAVDTAMERTNVLELRDVPVDELSGGQRQRVWVAMALAQETPLLLLDEPTTYLDVAHQIDLLELFGELHREGSTIVAVLHDLNHAARYATHLVALRAGELVAEGPPSQVVTAGNVERIFGLECVVIDDPVTHTPLVVPRSRSRAAASADGDGSA